MSMWFKEHHANPDIIRCSSGNAFLKLVSNFKDLKNIFFIFQPDSIRVMGDKATARETMKKAGVPTVPGSEGLLQVK